jgi:hypothetical protein
MLSKRYTFSELNQILMESNYGFNPRIGEKVESEDKKNNEKAVDDIMKQSKEFDGGITDKKKNTNKEDIQDFNKTTLDVKFASEPGDAYVERVKAQVHGFPSADNEKNSKIKEDNKSLDFEGNEEFYDAQKEKSKEVNDKEAELKHAGLKARELPKEIFKNDTLFKNENKTMKRLHFKNTVFLSEAQMLKKVPEEFKNSDGKFIMKDASDTEYLVECKYNDTFKCAKLTVLNKTNKEQINEELERMKQLYDYSSSNYMGGTTAKSRKNETKTLSEMIDHVKDMDKTVKGE